MEQGPSRDDETIGFALQDGFDAAAGVEHEAARFVVQDGVPG